MRLVLIAVVLILGCGAAGMTEDFRPELAELRIEPRAVRPGDAFTLSLTFVNRGSAVAADRYWVFLHFERPRKDCRDIVFQADYEPSLPTIGWEPGRPVVEGPRTVTVPGSAAEGEYWVHIGIFDQKTGKRYADTYAGAITVDARAAPPQRPKVPYPIVFRFPPANPSEPAKAPPRATHVPSTSLPHSAIIFELTQAPQNREPDPRSLVMEIWTCEACGRTHYVPQGAQQYRDCLQNHAPFQVATHQGWTYAEDTDIAVCPEHALPFAPPKTDTPVTRS